MPKQGISEKKKRELGNRKKGDKERKKEKEMGDQMVITMFLVFMWMTH